MVETEKMEVISTEILISWFRDIAGDPYLNVCCECYGYKTGFDILCEIICGSVLTCSQDIS